MSLASWKKEFYPTEASKCTKGKALEHSIRKWQGLTPAMLRKHGCELIGRDVCEINDCSNRVAITDSTCALCLNYIREEDCSECPLYRVRGDVQCDRERDDENQAPYAAFTLDHNPKPMLKWLRRAKAKYGRKAAKK